MHTGGATMGGSMEHPNNYVNKRTNDIEFDHASTSVFNSRCNNLVKLISEKFDESHFKILMVRTMTF